MCEDQRSTRLDFKDVPIEKIIERCEAVLSRDPTALCFVKWTCPKCGERAESSQPNVVCISGYVHEGCGYHYQGKLYGLMVILGLNEEARKVLEVGILEPEAPGE